jgi:hypothetical protein
MPLLDHFHPPLHGPRRWEGFHHAWATLIAQQLNQETLPSGYFAEPEISLGPALEIDVATMELKSDGGESSAGRGGTAVWSPPRPRFAPRVDFAHLDTYEVRVFRDLDGAELCAAVELVSPANKDRAGSRRTFAAKCAGYLQHGINVVVVDVVTARLANLHRELADVLEIKGRPAIWESTTGLSAVAYRAVAVRRRPRVEIWPEVLALGRELPSMPLWLAPDLCVSLGLEDSYTATCRSLRIPA